MGNTVGTTKEGPPFRGVARMTDAEHERLFREKIGYISIIKNRQIRRSASHDGHQIPGAVVSSINSNSRTWDSSVTSDVTQPTFQFPERTEINVRPKSSDATNPSIDEIARQNTSIATGPQPLEDEFGFSLDKNKAAQGPVAGKLLLPSIHSFQSRRSAASSVHPQNNAISQRHAISSPHANLDQMLGRQNSRMSQTTAPETFSTSTPGRSRGVSKAITSISETTTVSQGSKNQQGKGKANEESRESNLDHEIKAIHQELEAIRAETHETLQTKDATIQRNEAEIAALKQELVALKTEHESDKSAAYTETRTLLRRVTNLQSHLITVERERDAALAALESSDQGSSIATPKEEELKEAIHDLLKQIEDSEDQHQREQKLLQDEIMLMRKKLERLESQYIVVERERDTALQNLDSCQVKMQVQKAVAKTDMKCYQDEIAKWKERYDQEFRFSSNQDLDNRLNKTAVNLGHRLSAGILEGIQEDEELVVTSDHNGVRTARLDDDSSDYSQMYQMLRFATSPNAMSDITVTATNVNPRTGARLNNLRTNLPNPPNYGRTPPANLESKQSYQFSENSNSIAESISIPGFLSQVW